LQAAIVQSGRGAVGLGERARFDKQTVAPRDHDYDRLTENPSPARSMRGLPTGDFSLLALGQPLASAESADNDRCWWHVLSGAKGVVR
jgi:hypothetical protein